MLEKGRQIGREIVGSIEALFTIARALLGLVRSSKRSELTGLVDDVLGAFNGHQPENRMKR